MSNKEKIASLKQLSSDELRIKVAELNDWKPNGAGYWHKNKQVRGLVSEDGGDWGSCKGILALPDYPNDLNVMREILIEIYASEELSELFEENLIEIVSYDYGYQGVYCWANASARQKAEAYILTMETFKLTTH